MTLNKIAERAKKYKPKPKITYKMMQEHVESNYGFKVHIAYITEVKHSLGLTMYDAPNAVGEEISYFLDYLLDFVCDERMLGLYKKVCRAYLYIYPSCIKSYIDAYREM